MPEERAQSQVPTVDDETIYQVLRNLVYLGNERLSYRNLYEEQIGSVYEALMGYYTMRVESPSVRIKPSDSKVAPIWLSAEELLNVKPAQRSKWLKETAGLRGARAKNLLQDLSSLEKDHGQPPRSSSRQPAERLEEERVKGSERSSGGKDRDPARLRAKADELALHAALALRADRRSHAGTAARDFGDEPSSDQILSLTVCDPAMGSGAFLVEACRYLGERLLEAWVREGRAEELRSQGRRRLSSMRVVSSPSAASTASTRTPSQWSSPSSRSGSSLFNERSRLRSSITTFAAETHWSAAPSNRSRRFTGNRTNRWASSRQSSRKPSKKPFAPAPSSLERSLEDTPEANRAMRTAMEDADDALSRLRIIGDLLIGAFFSAEARTRRAKASAYDASTSCRNGSTAMRVPPTRWSPSPRRPAQTLRPFHWMIEFPEVFYAGRVDPLSQTNPPRNRRISMLLVGNPPFAGKNSISDAYGSSIILDWFKVLHPKSHGNADLCAHFFRRMEALLGEHGTIGLIATNTIAQGDTRATGLQACSATRSHHLRRDRVHALARRGCRDDLGGPSRQRESRRTRVGTILLNGLPVAVINSRLRPKPERADPRATAGE